MPEEIMVASWRVMTVSSWALTFFGPERELHAEPGLLLDQVHHGQAAGLQLGGDRLTGEAGDLALLGRAGRVDGLERVGGGRHQAATSSIPDSIELAHLGGLGGAALGGGHRDPALADEPGERGVHRLHAVLAARLDQRVDLVRLALADQVAHARGRDEHLGRDAAADAVGGRDQRLGHDALEADRQLGPDLALLGRREDVDDAVHGLRRVLGVQRGEDEVAGLGRGQGRADRLHVAHLADEDDVGVLAQRGLEAEREGRRVRPQLALVDDALLVVVQELDRVLDGEDVLVARLVDLVDDRGERRRLARARGARDEHEPARLLGEGADDRRHAELLERHRLRGDQAEGGGERAALEVRVDAEAAVAGDRVGEVDLPLGLQALALRGVEDRVDDLPRVRRRELRHPLEGDQRALLADHGRRAGRQVKVGGLLLHDLDEDVGEVEVHRPLHRHAGRSPEVGSAP